MKFWFESLAVKHVVSLGKAAPPLCAPAHQSLWSATIQSLPDVSLEARKIMAISGRKTETSLEGSWKMEQYFIHCLEPIEGTTVFPLHKCNKLRFLCHCWLNG